MKVLVTGATGFIGQYVVKSVLNKGYKVVALARFTDKATFYQDSMISPVKYEINLDNHSIYEITKEVDVLIHLAWSHVNDVNSHVHEDFNLPAHYDFIKRVIESGVKNIFVLGSCYEYGICEGAINERHPTKPITAYGMAKDRLRSQLELLSENISFNLTWGRLFYIYGEGQTHLSIYNQLMSAIENGYTEFKMSQGDQELDYLQVQEAADIIVKLSTKKRNIGCVNICSGKPSTLLALVERWIDEKNGNIVPSLGVFPYRPYEPRSFWGDRSYLDKLLKL